jgi:hypothetical protein
MSDLSQIRFLVLDKADWMVQKHCFPQLVQILESVHSANPGSEQEEDDDGEDLGIHILLRNISAILNLDPERSVLDYS